MKRSLISLLINREMQIKSTMTCHFTPVRVTIIKHTHTHAHTQNNKYWCGCGEKIILEPVSGMAKWCDHCEKYEG